jgi:L-lactate dehydrogenase (cytochrome)
MRLREIGEQARWPALEPDRDRRVIAQCHDLDDLRREARRRLPGPVFGYVDGADEELTLRANQQAFRRWQFRPRVLRDVTSPDLGVTVLGRELPVPIGLAPTGYTRMLHHDGEVAVARAAASRHVPYGLSTTGTSTIDQLAATGHHEMWFQLYVLRDRKLVHALIDQAAAAGSRALEVTVDTPVAAHRKRDLRAGLTIPPSLAARSMLGIAVHPGYWLSALRSPALEFASLQLPGAARQSTIAGMASLFDPSLTWDDFADIRSRWPGPLLIKGSGAKISACQPVAASGLATICVRR